MPHKLAVEHKILVPSRCVFRQRKIVHVNAKSGRAARVRVADPNNALLPPSRKHGRLRANTVRVIAVRLVKLREFANGDVNQVSALGVIAWINIRFDRLKRNLRQLHLLRVDCLAADYDDLGVTRNLTGGANNMFELSTIHK